MNPVHQDFIMDAHILDTDIQYTQSKFKNLFQKKQIPENKSVELFAWRGEVINSQIGVISFNKELTNLNLKSNEFFRKDNNKSVNFEISHKFVKSTLAYDDMPNSDKFDRRVPKGKRKESSDILYTDKVKTFPIKSIQPIWLNIYVPQNVQAGAYQGKVFVYADQLIKPIELQYNLNVLEAKIVPPQQYRNKFDIELWQNPYAVAEYYKVEPFSREHFELLIPHMKLYKSKGGNAITATIVEEAWDGQTFSENEIKFPSMVKWIKNKDGYFKFDYTDFDKWIKFCKLLNLGSKISCYSLAPWNNKIIYFDEVEKKYKEMPLKSRSAEYTELWSTFLKDFINHVESLGIKSRVYLGIDERGFNSKIFEIIKSTKGSDGLPLKISAAMDSFVENKELSMQVTDLTVGTIAIKKNPQEFKELIKERKKQNLRTTVYSCTGHIPGNFSLSEPVESYWTILFSYAVGGEGFLRWAYDSWVKNPLQDTSNHLFEAGDTFLVYPDNKTKENPEAKTSIRLEKMTEGLRDVQKLDLLRNISESYNNEIENILSFITKNYDNNGLYLTDSGKEKLLKDINIFKNSLLLITKKALKEGYILEKDPKKNCESIGSISENEILPSKYLSTIEKSPNTDRQYLGQPDLIMLNDEEILITVYPAGHGKGKIIMQVSDDAGINWSEKKDTPESWNESYETPTLYKLNFKNGDTKLILISGRPNWAGNNKGGWDTSLSHDLGNSWSEFQTYHPKLDNGKENFSLVAMSSLIRTKDENGNWEDRWLGVYHDENFINYKTYLTFNEDGTENWSSPIPYLTNHRIIEQITKICEVCLLRSPDEQVVTAVARTQSHEHPSVIFHSYNEGEDWTEPIFLSEKLHGERHKAVYIPNTDKLIFTFRSINLFKNEQKEICNWEAGHWTLWAGNYEDLLSNKNRGLVRTIAEDFTQSEKGGDTGYAGLVIQQDGTIISNSYGHWDKSFSENWLGQVTKDLSYIKLAKFKLEDLY